MSTRTLERIKLGINPQTGAVLLYRHGSNPGIALEARSAFQEMFLCFIGTMMFKAENNHREEVISIGGKRYRISATMLEDPKPATPMETAPNAEVPQDQELPKAD